jgi:hypothetical protein
MPRLVPEGYERKKPEDVPHVSDEEMGAPTPLDESDIPF